MNACLTCGADVSVKGAEQGEIFTCGECGTDLEVLSLEPIVLGLAPETKEDWGSRSPASHCSTQPSARTRSYSSRRRAGAGTTSSASGMGISSSGFRETASLRT